MNRLAISIGVIIFILGLAVLLAWSAFEIFISEMHLVPKIALFLILAGTLLIFCTVLTNRLKIRKSDPYKDVEL